MPSERRLQLKKKCVTYLGGKCIKCGYCNCVDALDFHHKDPNTKSFSIADALHAVRGLSSKWEVLQPELDKCEILCRNCHAELHFEEAEKRREYRRLHPRKRPKKNKFLGWPDVSIVEEMVKTLGFAATGRQLGVSDNGVRKFLRRQPRGPNGKGICL